MQEILDMIFSQYEIFLIVIVRISGIYIFSPFFSSQNVPSSMKIGLTFTLGLILTLALPQGIIISDQSMVLLIVREFMVGLIIGFIAYAFMTSFYVLGQLVDMKIGFGMANVFDPQNKVQVPLMGNVYYILAFLFLLMLNGHHIIIQAIIDSYKFIPIGTFIYNEDVLSIIVNSVVQSFNIGFRLSLPILAIVFLTDVLLGIMVKAIPQMNVFVVGMPLKVFIGLIVIMLTMPIFYGSVSGIFDLIVNDIYHLLKL